MTLSILYQVDVEENVDDLWESNPEEKVSLS